MDLGLLYRALDQGQVTMVAGNTTDGVLAKMDFTVLEDDRSVFPPYEAAAAVRTSALGEFPGLRAALAELSGAVTEDLMREMNLKVDGEHRPIQDVAREFLSRLSR
jgi:osmoprotectant transport system substrate-binding protein